MNDFEDRLRSSKRKNAPLPSIVSKRIDETLTSLPDRKSKKKPTAYVAVAAVILFVLLVGSAYYSPAVARTLQSLPIVGSVFEVVGDPGLEKAGEKGLVTRLNQTIQTDHVSLAFTDVVYDGTRLSIGYVKQWDSGLKQTRMEQMHDIYDRIAFKVNGKFIHYRGLGGTGKYLNEDKYAGVMTLKTEKDLPDHFNLTVVIHHLGREKGEWTASFPVQKISGQNTFLAHQVKSYKNKTMVVNKVTFTPTTTEVRFQIRQPVETLDFSQYQHIMYQLYDDHGMMLQPFSFGGGGSPEDEMIIRDMTALYEPLKKIPEYLIFQPVIPNFNEEAPKRVKAELSGKLPLRLNQGKAGSVSIMDVQYKEDKMILRYRVEGKVPYRQASAVWITDENGEDYHSKEPPKRISDTEYIFQRRFPSFNLSENLTVTTVKIQPPTPIQSLRMKIPLER